MLSNTFLFLRSHIGLILYILIDCYIKLNKFDYCFLYPNCHFTFFLSLDTAVGHIWPWWTGIPSHVPAQPYVIIYYP